jgi:hypothetical protein
LEGATVSEEGNQLEGALSANEFKTYASMHQKNDWDSMSNLFNQDLKCKHVSSERDKQRPYITQIQNTEFMNRLQT